MIVVDVNVLAYFWLPSRFAGLVESAKARDGVWAAPVLWRSEFRNVLAGCLRRKLLTEPEANAVYAGCSEDLGEHEYSVPTDRVLRLVSATRAMAYDCEYAALAMDLKVPLVTVSRQLLKEFPKVAVALETFAQGTS